MNKYISLASIVAAYFVCCQPNYAQSAPLTFGQYKAVCGPTDTSGASTADTRNITVLGIRQQVVHLEAQNQSQAEAFVHDASGNIGINVALTAPIQFNVPSGNANRLTAVAVYTPPGSSLPVFSQWTTSTTALPIGGNNFIVTGNTYFIPLGGTGIPVGSTLNCLWFVEGGNTNNCNTVMANINAVAINGSILGIDATAADTCGNSCQ
ncbi:MAG TPA: hypothetical protein V6C76_14385 [Drouetiella sp.]